MAEITINGSFDVVVNVNGVNVEISKSGEVAVIENADAEKLQAKPQNEKRVFSAYLVL